jgi:hypothetical protein
LHLLKETDNAHQLIEKDPDLVSKNASKTPSNIKKTSRPHANLLLDLFLMPIGCMFFVYSSKSRKYKKLRERISSDSFIVLTQLLSCPEHRDA